MYDKMLMFNIFFVVFFIILAIIFCQNKDFNIKTIFIENGFTFLFIGIVEVMFFLKIAYKYIPIAPSFLVTKSFAYMKEKMMS